MKQIASILKTVFEKETKLENEETTLLHKQVQNSLPATLQCWAPEFFHCTTDIRMQANIITDLVSMQRTLAVELRT